MFTRGPMRIRILALATLIVSFSVGCSSSGGSGSTTTPDEGPDQLPAEQTDSGMGTSGDSGTPTGETQENPVEVDSTPTNPLDGMGAVQQVGSGFGFLEGPAYRSSDSSLYFSDIPANTIHRLLPDGSIESYRENQQTNGLAFDQQDRLLIATQGGRTLSRMDQSGNVTVLVDRFEGALLNSPNDVALHSNGDVYFTDPPYGIDEAASEVGCAGIYRLAANGDLSVVYCNGIYTRPNGIALSPDQDRLLVTFTATGEVLSWPVEADGSVGQVGNFAPTSGNADGMAVDAEGNVFIATAAGVEVFAPDGTLWGAISIPENTTNCTLGGPNGKTLFVTGVTGLYTVELQ